MSLRQARPGFGIDLTRLVNPGIRSYMFGTLVHDPDARWAEELDIIAAIGEFRSRLRQKWKVPHLGLYRGSDPAFSVIPLAFLAAPFYVLAANLGATFSPAQLAVTAVACVYSLIILVISIDVYRLYLMGEFGDKHLVAPRGLKPGSKPAAGP
jgi:hypothetical protein